MNETNLRIGRLAKVDPRTLWMGEASHFTPWLAKEDNIQLLADTTGLDLELVSEEKSVGPFRADILCKNTLDDSFVLIENQLEKTDHTHLGQLMTYAAGLEAVTIIWISRKFTEEHRAALDWLNRVTDEKLRFFGIELEVYRIGESDPAPMFQLVSKPNDWAKAVHSSQQKNGELTEVKALNLDYWRAMKTYFEEKNSSVRFQKPQAQHWTNFAIGRSHFGMAAVASVRDNFIRVSLNVDGPRADEHFEMLKEKFEEESMSMIDPQLSWELLEDKRVNFVSIQKDVNVSDKDDWPNQFYWFLERLEAFNKYFRPRIKQLP